MSDGPPAAASTMGAPFLHICFPLLLFQMEPIPDWDHEPALMEAVESGQLERVMEAVPPLQAELAQYFHYEDENPFLRNAFIALYHGYTDIMLYLCYDVSGKSPVDELLMTAIIYNQLGPTEGILMHAATQNVCSQLETMR